ncbi:MAG: pyruvate kinase [Bacteroidales bacterium]|nr:pyruvate kinase [Bacteroidales bacterium]
MKTKIVATVGPACSSAAMLKKMIFAGVDVFRLNFSHANYDEFERIIKDIHDLNKKLETHVAILADLQGPKIRIGELAPEGVFLKDGQTIRFTTDKSQVAEDKIFISYQNFPKDVKAGETILLDDGKMILRISRTDGKTEVAAKVINGGLLTSRKGVNLPNTRLSLPSLSEKDKEDVRFIMDHNFDWVALSFVRVTSDIEGLISMMNSYSPDHRIPVIAKIEKPEAVKNIDSIIQAAHGVMVARGDLGVEIPLQNVPMIQKMIVKKCLAHAKPVIIATQMMEGMLTNPRPTRAEVNDVANSVMDGADALMLSGETSVGKYPAETVETMQKIISEVEQYDGIYHKNHVPVIKNNLHFISDSIIYSGCNVAREAKAKAIVSVASSGYSTAKISSHRPKATIFGFANNNAILRRLNLLWGVKPVFFDRYFHTDQTINDLIAELRQKGLVQSGDLLVHISNMPINQPGKSNMLKLGYVE